MFKNCNSPVSGVFNYNFLSHFPMNLLNSKRYIIYIKIHTLEYKETQVLIFLEYMFEHFSFVPLDSSLLESRILHQETILYESYQLVLANRVKHLTERKDLLRILVPRLFQHIQQMPHLFLDNNFYLSPSQKSLFFLFDSGNCLFP